MISRSLRHHETTRKYAKFCYKLAKKTVRFSTRELKYKRLSRRRKIVFDRMRGLDFISTIMPEEAGLDPKLAHKFSPSGNVYLERVLSDLDIRNYHKIIDVGCGKGSAMRTMLKFPFAHVDGVEVSEYLAEIAVRNFDRLNLRKVGIFVDDAVEFQHFGDYDFLYAYNPFPCEIMTRLVKNLARSIERDRRVVLLYNTPICHHVIVESGIFFKIGEYPNEWGDGINVYSNDV